MRVRVGVGGERGDGDSTLEERNEMSNSKGKRRKSDGERRERYFGRCEKRTHHPGGSVSFQPFNVFN